MSGVDLNKAGEFGSLRDLAIREVVQLLDDHESVELESGFMDLTPDQQAEILDLQAAVAREINAAGDDVPERSLRYRVLARVSEAIENDAEAVAPIASIGRHAPRSGFSPTVASESAAPLSDVAMVSWGRMRTELGWRAAALVFGAALVVLGVMHWRTSDSLDRFERYAIGELPYQDLLEQDASIAAFQVLLRSTTKKEFALASAMGPGSARVVFEPKTKSDMLEGLVIVDQLPVATEMVQLLILGDDGSEILVGQSDVSPGGLITAFGLSIDRNDLAPGSTFILKDGLTGQLLLGSNTIGA
ncbi:MAG: hypothetical protein GY895_16535 [Phycisphaera sp.]|nr:hypothetical protein [Phycisphaera sp.]